jgi:hypothetical protein
VRITRIGATITTYYRVGAVWVLIASGVRTLDNATLGLGASSFLDRFAHQAVDIAWDNFRINSGTISCPTWWDDSSPNWQAATK